MARLVQTNADMKTINLKSRSRFPTIMCRSIDSRQVGLSEATNVLYLDDCVEGLTRSSPVPSIRLDLSGNRPESILIKLIPSWLFPARFGSDVWKIARGRFKDQYGDYLKE